MKFLFVAFLSTISLASHAAYFCGTVEEIQNKSVTYNLVNDDGNTTNFKISVNEDAKTIALAKLIKGNTEMKLCTHDHYSTQFLDSQYITNIDRLVK
jgi:predicted hotdog family 3-hydroxylacyl-ACP dehydratase